MDEIVPTLGRAISEALSHTDASTLVFLTVANLVQLALILFLVVVAPVWIIRHYNATRDDAAKLADHQRAVLEKLEKTANRIEERMDTLEKILDADAPNWKERT